MTAFNQASGSAKVEAALAAMSCQCATPVAGCAGVADGELRRNDERATGEQVQKIALGRSEDPEKLVVMTPSQSGRPLFGLWIFSPLILFRLDRARLVHDTHVYQVRIVSETSDIRNGRPKGNSDR